MSKNKTKERKKVFRSMKEFEKYFLPKSLLPKPQVKSKDAKALGISLAKESLETIKGLLAK